MSASFQIRDLKTRKYFMIMALGFLHLPKQQRKQQLSIFIAIQFSLRNTNKILRLRHDQWNLEGFFPK